MICAILIKNPVWLAGQDLTHQKPLLLISLGQPAFSSHFKPLHSFLFY